MPVYNQEIYRKEKHWKEGEFDVYRNMQWTGPGCHEGCGCLFYVKDGKLDHIEGDPNDEFSRGRLCMRCLNMVDEAVNNPTRIARPLTWSAPTGTTMAASVPRIRAPDSVETTQLKVFFKLLGEWRTLYPFPVRTLSLYLAETSLLAPIVLVADAAPGLAWIREFCSIRHDESVAQVSEPFNRGHGSDGVDFG